MEEGSLLAEALNSSAENLLENALVVDVFLLPAAAAATTTVVNNNNSSSSSSINLEQHLLELADLGVRLNDFIRKTTRSHQQDCVADADDGHSHYPWIQGGDGPVFGIHTSWSNDMDTKRSSSSTTAATGGVPTGMMIPHLRAICRYGVSVADEWKMISLVMEFSNQHHHREQQHQQQPQQPAGNEKQQTSTRMVVECIDVDDGQILMIQGADALPEWADRIGPQNCRHRCWIQKGKIHLITPPSDVPAVSLGSHGSRGSSNTSSCSLSLSQALDCLSHSTSNSSNSDKTTNQSQYHAGVQEQVQQAIDRVVNNNHTKYCQRTALLVPRSVANLVQCRPDLAAVAYQAWARQRQQERGGQGGGGRGRQDDSNSKYSHQASRNKKDPQKEQSSSSASSLLLVGTCHDWIWTVDNHMSRTVHAMLRTMVLSGSPNDNAVEKDNDWTRPDSIPKRYQSIEVKRLQRHVQSLQPPVLQSSLALGVRLVAGLQQLLDSQQENQTNNNSGNETTSSNNTMRQSQVERRVLDYWSRIDRQCRFVGGSSTDATDTSGRNDNDSASNWLVQAWKDGPNHSKYNLESIMKCPVFADEVQDHATPITHPDLTVPEQVRHELLRQPTNKHASPQAAVEIPRLDQVDSDEWMTLPSLSTDQDLFFQQTLGLPSFQHELMNENNVNNDGGPVEASLDQMLHGFQDFIQGESGIDGVDHHKGSGAIGSNIKDSGGNSEEEVPEQQPVRIHPVAFLNLLHKSLAIDSVQELEAFLVGTGKAGRGDDDGGDYFFSEEDYRLAEPDSTDDEDSTTSSSPSGSISKGGNDEEMMNLMGAMDSQLLEHDGEALSRPGGTDVRVDDALLDTQEQEDIARDALVLSNLIESLEAGAGAPGPVQNILSEMSGK